MIFINRIINLIKSIFNKQNTVKNIDAPNESTSKEEKICFQESLKNINKEIEIPICYGDGLGIRNKINY